MLNVNPMHALNQTEFRIHLEEDNIILHGSSRESAGTVLRGYILLNSPEQIKVKSIVLKFVGKTNVYWAEGKRCTVIL
jgi:hypothetical protein